MLCASMVLHLVKSGKFKVSWITTHQTRLLLGDIPGVNFIIVPKPKNLKSFFKCHRMLNAYSFDCLLLAQASFSAHFVSMSVRSKRKIGFDASRSKDLHDFFINEHIEEKEEHFLDAYFSFARKLGLGNPAEFNWEGLFDAQDDKKLQKLNLASGKPILAVNPSASKSERNWTIDSYVKVIDYAHQKGLSVVVIGGSNVTELNFNSEICSGCLLSPINLTGRVELCLLPYLLKKVDMLLAPDTGCIHIARAVGTPVIGLYAVANPRLTGPYQADEFSIDKFDLALEQFSDSKNKSFYSRVHHPDAMSLIQTDEVISKVDSILDRLSLLPAAK
jgi:heptosyltransferase I